MSHQRPVMMINDVFECKSQFSYCYQSFISYPMGQACCDTRTSDMDFPDITINKAHSLPDMTPITVATLNYSLPVTNPFQYHNPDVVQQLEEINQIFQRLLPRYFTNYIRSAFHWQCHRLAEETQGQRYSPLFNLKAGLKGEGIMGKAEFEDKWDQEFDRIVAEKKIDFNEDERQDLKTFDTMVFHALLEYCFGVGSINDAEYNDYHDYIILVRPFHNLTHLDQAAKLTRFLEGYQKIQPDLFIVHNAPVELSQHFKAREDYWTAEDEHWHTLIVATASSFKELKGNDEVSKVNERVQRQLNPQGKTSFMCVDELVIIAPHLSTDPEESQEQVIDFKRGLVGLMHNLPEKHLIVAGGFGSFVELEEGTIMEKAFRHYPANSSQVTVRQKLTYLQTNFSLADQLVEAPADQILTTLNIQQPKLTTFREEETVDKLTPSAGHPFEHFAVWARILGQ